MIEFEQAIQNEGPYLAEITRNLSAITYSTKTDCIQFNILQS